MYYKPGVLVNIFVIFYLFHTVSAKVEFRNINCTSLDTEFSNFEYCYLKSVNRTYKYMSLKVNLFKVPISKIKVNFAVLKRYNGPYRPFLYNVTVDGCRYLKSQKSYRIASYLYNLFASHSNINHTCPYDHDLIVEKLSSEFLNNQLTKVLPVPEGDYGLESSWIANNILRAKVTVFINLS